MRYFLIVLLAFAGGILTFAVYLKFFGGNETISTQNSVSSERSDQGETFDNVFDPSQRNALDDTKQIKTTPALDELTLHESKIKSELTKLLLEFVPQAEVVLVKQFELRLVQLEIAKVSLIPESKRPLLTYLYGKLLVRKVEAEIKLYDAFSNHGIDSSQAKKQGIGLREIEKELSEIASADPKESKSF